MDFGPWEGEPQEFRAPHPQQDPRLRQVVRITPEQLLEEIREMGLMRREMLLDDPDRETWQRKSRPVRIAFYNALIDGLGDDEFFRLASL